ncbi:hypothetical protein [Epilithonimonas hispanica]|uniref:Uncharacterized protein n=1 Tax=Epilithonimonas hispanica TaxID=358687 RepID=A0A3D9CTW0_9FLAO|nr:hypothetical protein [Epilithonimonas hispanica]REC69131.1 hypothetical protein DRF58_12850 [Epilithonimonas hispanica]
MNYVDNSTKVSTAFGTVLTLFVNVPSEDVVKTIVLASVGGISSFAATLMVKFLIRNIKNKFQR